MKTITIDYFDNELFAEEIGVKMGVRARMTSVERLARVLAKHLPAKLRCGRTELAIETRTERQLAEHITLIIDRIKQLETKEGEQI